MIVKAYLNSSYGALFRLTLACAVLHAANAVFAVIVYITINDMRNFNTPICKPTFDGTYKYKLHAFDLNITLSAMVFSLLSSIFHCVSLLTWSRYANMLSKKYNVLRWIEYSLSAPTMAVIISTIGGVNDITTLLYQFAAVSFVMWVGLLVELAGLGSYTSNYISIIANIMYGTVLAANFINTFIYKNLSDTPAVVYVTSTTLGFLFACFGYYQAYWQLVEFFGKRSSNNHVLLKVYDLSFGLAKGLSDNLVGVHVDLIPHTSIVVYGCEIFLMNGIQCVSEDTAERIVGMTPSDVIKLGSTDRTSYEIVQWLNSEALEKFKVYNLLTNNCIDFCNSLSLFLRVDGVPSDIGSVPKDVQARNPDLYSLWSDHNMKYSYKNPPPKDGRLPTEYKPSNMSMYKYLKYEKGYLVLSLLAKTTLTYLILWAGLTGHEWTSSYSCDTAVMYCNQTYGDVNSVPTGCSGGLTMTMSSDVSDCNSPTSTYAPTASLSSSNTPLTTTYSASVSNTVTPTISSSISYTATPSVTHSMSPSRSVSVTPSPSNSGIVATSPAPSMTTDPSIRSYGSGCFAGATCTWSKQAGLVYASGYSTRVSVQVTGSNNANLCIQDAYNYIYQGVFSGSLPISAAVYYMHDVPVSDPEYGGANCVVWYANPGFEIQIAGNTGSASGSLLNPN